MCSVYEYIIVTWLFASNCVIFGRFVCGICECRSGSRDGGHLRKALDEIKDQRPPSERKQVRVLPKSRSFYYSQNQDRKDLEFVHSSVLG